MQMELLLIAGTAIAGVGLGAAVYLLARRPKPVEAPVEMEILEESAPATAAAPLRAAMRDPAPRAGPAARPAAPSSAATAATPAPTAPPASSAPRRGHPERAPAMVLTHGVQLRDESVRPRAAAPAPRPPMREPPPMKSWAQQTMEEVASPIPSEWARRQVGPAEPGRTKGACGGCGAALSVSNQRPLRIACPVCGRTKLLAA